MKNTLYEILEVSEKASKEVIEKAYKVLAKKYHPDLQKTDEEKKNAEEKMKKINEAYNILIDEVKRRDYDQKIKAERMAEEEKNKLNYENSKFKQEGYNDIDQRYIDMRRKRYEEELRKKQEEMQAQMKENLEKQYQNAYYNYVKSLGRNIKERWTWEKTKKLFLGISIIIIIGLILWIIPPTHNMMVDIYENNIIIKVIVNIIISIIKAFFETIKSIFS